MATKLMARLDSARRRRFVGRVEELALFQSAVQAVELPYFVLHIYGPGGVGKSSLLREYLYCCDQYQIQATYVDTRDLDPTPTSFLAALQQALGLTPPASPLDFFSNQTERHVLLIDTYEAVASLDRWLRQDFLPYLSDQIFTVLAGRDLPDPVWRFDSGWQSLVRLLPLRNLTAQDSQTYLTSHLIPAEHHHAILNVTYGHPLALSLVIDTFAQRQEIAVQATPSPDVVKTLLERLVQRVPGPAHRTALEASAIVRVTSEPLLAEMLGLPDQGTHEMFLWLRGLSFIEANAEGLFPHDLVRDVLVADLRWRNPDWYAELHRRAREYYARRMQETSGQVQHRILSNYVFLHRDNPVVRPFFEWQAGSSPLPDAMRPTDRLELAAMVATHEGEESADLAAYWFDRQPDGVYVFREPGGQPLGMMLLVPLHEVTAEDIAADPAVESTYSFLQHHAPLRPGEKATLFRFWLGRETYQDVSLVQSLVFLNAVRHYLTTPGLAHTFFPCADPDFWAPMFAYADLTRLPTADFEVGAWRYGMYGHDWRTVPPITWLALLAERETATEVETAAPQTISTPLVVLSRPDFENAVRDVLHHFVRPDTWHTNPLLRSRLVVERVGTEAEDAARITALQAILKETADRLQSSPRELKLYRAIHHTYFQPAFSQEQAAELLDVPFSSFRRHLKAGVIRITELLWQQEIAGAKK
jgi:hypothetical protein